MACENLCHLGVALQNLEKHSKSILKKIIPIMKEYNTSKSKKISKMSAETSLPENDCLDLIKKEFLRLASESESVRDEMNAFCEYILTNEPIDVEKTPFMSSVWFGDVYSGCEGLYALKKLEIDMIEIHENLSSTFIYDNVIKSIGKKE